MIKFYRFAIAVLMLGLVVPAAKAQEDEDEKQKPKGRVSAGFETNSVIYVKDEKTGAVYPDDHFGSNNYLKLDYEKGRFAVGVQFEAYTPVLQGFPGEYGKKADLVFKYVTWQDKSFSVTVGDFYEQFGNGLLFRSWEDRALGFNNSIEGARVTYNFRDMVNLKAIWGRPRYYMDRADTQVRGVDASLVISNMAGWDNHMLSLEGSYFNKHASIGNDEAGLRDKPFVDSYSGRINWEVGGFSLKTEYVAKSKDLYAAGTESPYKKGNAQLAEIGYAGNGLGVLATFRRLEFMENKIYPTVPVGDGNSLNYLPSLTQQYTYLLTNLHPYGTITQGEIGGQFDFFYNFKKGTNIGGKRGWKFHANFSAFYSLNDNGLGIQPDPDNGIWVVGENNLLYMGIGADVEKWWNRKLKTTLVYSFQDYNSSYGIDSKTYKRHIFVADVTYKFTPTISLRAEAQYLYSKDDERDWVAGLVELNFAPRWSVYFSDMYNHGIKEDDNNKKLNYYNAGFSYTYSRTRVAISYGRNRAGYVCSGGVCRIMPAYTGANIQMSMSF